MPPRALRAARLKVSSTFSKVAGSRDGVPGRAPQSAELSCALISAGGGLRGNPRRGFPLLFILGVVRVRRYFGWCVVPPAAIRPHFFGACPKKRCRAAKERRFFYPGGSTIRVSATASVVFTHLRPTWGGGGCESGAVAAALSGRSSSWASLSLSASAYRQKRFSLGLHSRFFAREQRNGVELRTSPVYCQI